MFGRRLRELLRFLLVLLIGGSLALGALGPFPPATMASTPRFTLTNVGANFTPYAINNNGHVAGDIQTKGGYFHGGLWANGTLTDLFASCTTCTDSHASALNNNDQVVGWVFGLVNAYTQSAFLYSKGKLTTLPNLPVQHCFPGTPLSGQAFGINDNGHIVGDTYCPGVSLFPWLYKNGTLTQIGTQAGDAFAINNADQIAGDITGFEIPPKAYVYSGGVQYLLGSLPGDVGSAGLAIDSHGNVLGLSIHDPHQNCEDDVLWQRVGAAKWKIVPLEGAGACGPGVVEHGAGAALSSYGEILGCFHSYGGYQASPCSGTYELGFNPFVKGVASNGSVVAAYLNNLVPPTCIVSGVAGVTPQGTIALQCWQLPPTAYLATPIKPSTPAYNRERHCPTPEEIADAGITVGGATLLVKKTTKPLLKWMTTLMEPFSFGTLLLHWYTECFLDPFDPNFNTVYAPQFVTLPLAPNDPCASQALIDESNQVLNHAARALSYLRAVYITAFREQSAFTFGADSAVSVQDQALSSFLDATVSEAAAFQTGMQDIVSKIQGTACDDTVSQDDVIAFINAIRANGVNALPPEEFPIFQLLGIAPAGEIPYLLAIDSTKVLLSGTGVLNLAQQLFGDLASALQ